MGKKSKTELLAGTLDLTLGVLPTIHREHREMIRELGQDGSPGDGCVKKRICERAAVTARSRSFEPIYLRRHWIGLRIARYLVRP